MVWQVLEMLADGMAWEPSIEQLHDSITKDAIAEPVKLSGEAFLHTATHPVINVDNDTSKSFINWMKLLSGKSILRLYTSRINRPLELEGRSAN